MQQYQSVSFADLLSLQSLITPRLTSLLELELEGKTRFSKFRSVNVRQTRALTEDPTNCNAFDEYWFKRE